MAKAVLTKSKSRKPRVVNTIKNKKTIRKPQKLDEEITSEEEEDIVPDNDYPTNGNSSKPCSVIQKAVTERPPFKQPFQNKEPVNLKKYSDYINQTVFKQIKEIHSSSAVSCLVVSKNFEFIIIGSKDGRIAKYNIDGIRLNQLKSHNRNSKITNKPAQPKGSILCMALSSDDRFLVGFYYKQVTSSQDKLIFIWDAASFAFINVLIGHRASVTGLIFQQNTYQLYSCSVDKMVKVWNVEKCGFIDTWYGHESQIYSIDSLEKEFAVTCANDATLRFWKVSQQSQLVFYNAEGTHQLSVAMITENIFLSGGFDGTLSLWSKSSKKPLVRQENVHHLKSTDIFNNEVSVPCQISSIGVIPNGDIIATGSYDGFINLFSYDADNNRLQFVKNIRCEGNINCLKFSCDGRFLVAGCGSEERLGRWKTFKDKSLNSVKIYEL